MMHKVTAFLESERAIYFLVALFVILGALYSITTPLFEAGDELWHYPYVQWLAHGNGLPVQDPAQKQLWEQEGGQPPLYYATNAALTFWIDTRDLSERLWRNPYAKIGVPLAFGNKNMIVHTAAENFPWRGTTLAVHLIRFISVLFSAGTVFLTYKIAREIMSPLVLTRRGAEGEVLAIFAASFVAFNPMFLFISASVNNDSLAALLATAAIFLCVQLVTRGATNLRAFVLGIIVGLAILTKVSNLALGIVGMSVLAYCAWKQKSVRRLLVSSLLFLLPIFVLDAWWFARNYFLYGDVTAFNVWLQIAGGRPPQTLLGLLNEFQGFRISFWGNFGGVNIIAPEWVYTALDLFSLLALIGIIIGALRRTLPALWWIPALQVAVVFIALIRWTLLTYASQGRLMFPAIASISILFALGLYEIAYRVSRIADSKFHSSPFAPRLSPLILLFAFSFFLFAFSLAAPFFLIAPVYAQPARLADETQVPNPVHIKYDAGDAQPELVGFDAPRFLQGNELPLKLYWRTDNPIPRDLPMYVHVYDARGELIGQWDAFTGNGLLPTHLWQPNEIYADEYRVPLIIPDAYPPLGRIEVGMTRVGAANVLPARNPQGETITPSLAQFKFSTTPPALPEPRLRFGNQFQVVNTAVKARRGSAEISFETTEPKPIRVKPNDVLSLWVALGARQIPDADYTLFAHVVDANGKIVAQKDAEPLDNQYPTTLWNAEEIVGNTLEMQLPRDLAAGTYTLEFGMYRAKDLQRLPVSGTDWGRWRVEGDHIVTPIEVAP
ncbi:MAG: hypothetical protein B6D41_09990 [Chloroflexi bacterium UTCFX4]|jgi:hypothetical protein|nr:MAG: hypothetical protein B6D41_09990 [Chloroflexi bacterium UTCFX4]